MKNLRNYVLALLVVFLVLGFAGSVSGFTVGDINLDTLSPHSYLDKTKEGVDTKFTFAYNDESIKVVQVLGMRNPYGFGVHIVRYIKDGALVVYENNKDAGYVLITLTPEEAERITNELLGWIKKQNK